ncbi:MAG: recombinase family protein [Candidatus Paceibacterota bacterium]
MKDNNMEKITKMVKAVIFPRVSSKEQEETGYSLDAQQELLKNYSDKHSFEVAKAFRVSESASGKKQRSTFNEMMAYMDKNKINILVCEKVDRLTRNFKDAIFIDEWLDKNENRQIHLVKDGIVLHKYSKSQEKLNWGIRILFAKNYTDNLSEEVKKGQKQKSKEGWLPTKPPLGYRTIGEKGHKVHVVDEKVAPYIKKMFDLYATGNYSTDSLGDKMYKLGLRSRGGFRVVKSKIHKLLSDPFYYGMFVWKGEVYQGKHEPLIDKDLFGQVREKMTRGSAPYHNKHFKELRGKIFCGNCGKTVTWEKQKGSWYGACKQCKAQLADKRQYIKQENVENYLLDLIIATAPKNERILAVLNKALKESHSEEIIYHETQVQSINNSLTRIQQRKKVLYDDRLDGRISPSEYDQKIEEFRQEETDLINSLSKLKSDNTEYYRVGIALHELALRAREIYLSKKATVEERRLLLSYSFSNVSVLRGDIRAEYTKAFQFLIDWMPKVNETLELTKDVENKQQKSTFVPSCPILLRG